MQVVLVMLVLLICLGVLYGGGVGVGGWGPFCCAVDARIATQATMAGSRVRSFVRGVQP